MSQSLVSRLAVRLRRRRFLAATLSVAVAAALGGCREARSTRLLAPTGQAPSPTPVAGSPAPAQSPELQRFLALSTLLTGYDQLDEDAGQRYLAALQTPPPGGMPLDQLYQATGVGSSAPPASYAALAATGALDQPAAKATAQAIAAYWYTGQVAATGETVVTYRDALGWEALTFTRAPGMCGGAFGFWSNTPPP
jgi:hypothetical protein